MRFNEYQIDAIIESLKNYKKKNCKPMPQLYVDPALEEYNVAKGLGQTVYMWRKNGLPQYLKPDQVTELNQLCPGGSWGQKRAASASAQDGESKKTATEILDDHSNVNNTTKETSPVASQIVISPSSSSSLSDSSPSSLGDKSESYRKRAPSNEAQTNPNNKKLREEEDHQEVPNLSETAALSRRLETTKAGLKLWDYEIMQAQKNLNQLLQSRNQKLERLNQLEHAQVVVGQKNAAVLSKRQKEEELVVLQKNIQDNQEGFDDLQEIIDMIENGQLQNKKAENGLKRFGLNHFKAQQAGLKSKIDGDQHHFQNITNDIRTITTEIDKMQVWIDRALKERVE